jgi:hypothetical protein
MRTHPYRASEEGGATGANAERLVAADGLRAVAAVFDGSDHDGTRYEAARIHVQLARLQHGPCMRVCVCVCVFNLNVGGRMAPVAPLAIELLRHGGIAMVRELLASTFQLLCAEGYESLAFLSTHVGLCPAPGWRWSPPSLPPPSRAVLMVRDVAAGAAEVTDAVALAEVAAALAPKLLVIEAASSQRLALVAVHALAQHGTSCCMPSRLDAQDGSPPGGGDAARTR